MRSACEFVHDVFDETYLGTGIPTAHPTLMTSWHSEATLEDALSSWENALLDRGMPERSP